MDLMPVTATPLSYGAHPDQVVYHYVSPHTVVAADSPGLLLVHGGYWREQFTYQLMEPLAQLFVAAGWDVFSLEYRRGPHTPWLEMLADTQAGFSLVQSMLNPGQHLVSIGHSVGGQIALFNVATVCAVVALSPVTDVYRTGIEQLGDDAVTEYFGPTWRQKQDHLESASPLHHTESLGSTPVLVVQGLNDDRVPAAHSLDYVQAAKQSASTIDALVLSDCTHVEQVNPAGNHWPLVQAWLKPILGL